MEKSEFFEKMLEAGQFSITEDGHALLFGEFVMLFPSGTVLKLIELLEKEVGETKASKIIFKLGEFQLEAAIKRYKKRYDIDKQDKRKILTFLFDILNILGWGYAKIDEISFEKKYAKITMKNSALPEKYLVTYKKKRKRPIDQYLLGWFSKTFFYMFEKEVRAKETKCMVCGDKYCEFDIKTKS